MSGRPWLPPRRPLPGPEETAAALREVRRVVAEGPFDDTWESLSGYRVPSWFRNAKLGIFVHWGAFAVAAHGDEWYPREMYRRGTEIARFHRETFGEPSASADGFGWKDFLPRFTAENLDVTDLAALVRRSGAQYVVPVAEHHDGFALYDEPRTRWTSLAVGPRRDLLDELLTAADEQHLVRGASSHRAEHWFYFHPGTGFDSDVRDPEFADLYGPAQPQATGPSEAFCEDWLLRTVRIVDRYRPQVLWFDWWIEHPAFAPWLRLLAAYYYNRAAQWGRSVVLQHKWSAFPPGTALEDVERGTVAGIPERPWQNDTSVSRTSWGWVEGHVHKTVPHLVAELLDVTAKNGCLLLNIGPRADGSVDPRERALLEGLGDWLAVNGEAVYGTRPWTVATEGPNPFTAGSFTDGTPVEPGPEDLFFTTRTDEGADLLYVSGVRRADDGIVRVRALGSATAPGEPPATVELLGRPGTLEVERTDEALEVRLPEADPDALGFALRMTFPRGDRPHRALLIPG
ncbi:alpha-L-fucosidase [Kineococcus gynurae]|uniref:alpha-L-fucosidase n=1 Tax=Kineococcus gynurae TaxID=452979 RepID=A0ABV5LT91_9ACTN